ncbi:hypothetical protein PGT21_017071 [Puccinia graminis f. sp. tritici]|uniref:Protein kinase domain-containing protein n=1 Tax=Puccinia graminis f. sp. tritici TaxID=56615 RepID=A0A5B0MUH0_PUCGR|nr:hypothetical protein PGT21_017071 [Puccinia graminis f. sp. tritici]KAA1092038.1 hypothetical protein PGTUg99_003930 [Puccinia graminis f. sp. tritici]
MSQIHPVDVDIIPGLRIQTHSVLGQGGFGIVYLAQSIVPGDSTTRAVKVIHKTHGRVSTAIADEIWFHSALSAHNHPNILSLIQTLETPTLSILVMPYMARGTLAHQIFDRGHFLSHPGHIKPIFSQITSAVRFCHAQGVAHRDIKPENILCGFDQVYLTDFGLATDLRHSTNKCGTRAYMSPECLGSFDTSLCFYDTFANDIWSLGIVLMNLLGSAQPWREARSYDPHFRAFVAQDTSLFNPIGESFEYSFILQMLCLEDRRMTAHQVLQALL